jgi:hypothetical protein
MSTVADVGQAFQTFIHDVVRKTNPSSQGEMMALRNQIYAALEEYFLHMLSGMQPQTQTDQITSDNVIIELVDSRTGQLYRRPVELRFEENDNGIVLTGEDMSCHTSSIVFLSDAYMKKLTDISGKGPNEHQCES